MSSSILSTSVFSTLARHASIQNEISAIEMRLSTGKRFESAIDGGAEYFTSKALYRDAADFMTFKSNISTSASLVNASLSTIESEKRVIEQMRSLVSEAQQKSEGDRGDLQTQVKNLANEIDSMLGDAILGGDTLFKPLKESMWSKNSYQMDAMALASADVLPTASSFNMTAIPLGATGGAHLDNPSSILAPNGKLYAMPYDGDRVLEIDPVTGDSQEIGDVYTGGAKYFGNGAIASNGNIYVAPVDAGQILEINPTTGETNLVGDVLPGSAKYAGFVAADNGKFYATPRDAGQVMEFNPETYEIRFIGDSFAGTNKWREGVLADNGKIYAIPSESGRVLEIDPETGETNLVGTDYGSGTYKWGRGVLAPNGKIYAAPVEATQVLEFDPATGQTNLIGDVFADPSKWSETILAPNGKLYSAPLWESQFLEIDPETGTTTKVGNIATPYPILDSKRG
ncbi:MAG: flagellin N-terminal helical domain-containing protein [Alphaproteobacteria bacterium]